MHQVTAPNGGRMTANEIPGISVDHWFRMRARNPAFLLWSDALLPAVGGCVGLRPLNESLTRWAATRLGPWQAGADERDRWESVLYTPPARPEWLTGISRDAAA